jgi:hypothetical protein
VAAFFEVDEPYEVNALLTALLEAKFHPDPKRREVAGSPFVARLCERAVEAFAAAQAAGRLPGNPEQTRAFYQGRPGEPTLAVVRRRLAEVTALPVWAGWSPEQRAEYVRLLLSPFAAPDDLVAELIASVQDAEPGAAPDTGRR